MAAEGHRLERGRQALHEALARFREQIDRDSDLVAEQDTSTRLLMQLLRLIKEGKYDDLILQELPHPVSERTVTRAAPEQPLTSGTVTAHASSALAASALLICLQPDSSLGPVNAAALHAECVELRRKLKALSTNFKVAKASLRKRVDERDGWANHATRLEHLISTAEKKHGIKIMDPRTKSPRDPAPAAVYAIAQRDHDASFKEPPEASSQEPKAFTVLPNFASGQIISNEQSESTQGDTDDGSNAQLPHLPPALPNACVLIKQEPSSDEPVLVSERAVRKRRRNDSFPAAAEQRPKAELTDGSSPVLARIRYAYPTQEDLDLGEIEQRIATPWKRKESEQPQSGDSPASPKTGTSYTSHLVASAGYKQTTQDTIFGRQPPVLAPLSVNVQKCGRGEGKPAGRPLGKDLSFAISALAEDGGAYVENTSVMKNQTPTAAVPHKSRLHQLLHSPSAASSSPVIPRPGSRSSGRVSKNQLPVPECRKLPFCKDAAQAGISSQAKARSASRPALPPNESKTQLRPCQPKSNIDSPSLRFRPLSELRLDDFRINPLANDGHDFAFADVVRDKGERACLPGCTDLHCCGKQFRALALSQRPDPPLTRVQRMEEHQLLEGYLGDDAYKLDSMSKEERAELWIEAKTQELANKYGKHRHRFSRMQSPPGFWNADFPSTQELHEDRAEAAKRGRQAVAKRHREAMRPNGRWLFRDE